MDFLQILVLTLYITQAFTKSRRHYSSSSEEGSIENLLYYKDCQTTAKPSPPPVVMPLSAPMYRAPPPPRQPECPFPKMCCALTCGNECGGPPRRDMYQQPIDQAMPPNVPIYQHKKKLRIPQPNFQQPPLPTRRDFSGLTKDRIKGLIAQDDDIRKILKDLVRVTMQKVDLQDMLANQNNGVDDVSTARSVSPLEYGMNDFIE